LLPFLPSQQGAQTAAFFLFGQRGLDLQTFAGLLLHAHGHIAKIAQGPHHKNGGPNAQGPGILAKGLDAPACDGALRSQQMEQPQRRHDPAHVHRKRVAGQLVMHVRGVGAPQRGQAKHPARQQQGDLGPCVDAAPLHEHNERGGADRQHQQLALEWGRVVKLDQAHAHQHIPRAAQADRDAVRPEQGQFSPKDSHQIGGACEQGGHHPIACGSVQALEVQTRHGSSQQGKDGEEDEKALYVVSGHMT
jgi:hypothetical protein